jgi:threonine/homoserine/homoserine lactone efflux protein
MGIRVLWLSRHDHSGQQDASQRVVGRPIRSGFVTNVLNLKIAVFYTSLLPSLIPAGGAPRTWLPIFVGTQVLCPLRG